MKKLYIFLIAACLTNVITCDEKQMPDQTILDEYSPTTCLFLEALYGKGMISEGEKDEIDHMFSDIKLYDQTALDFGSGLGGTSLHLANRYHMKIIGLDINPWLINYSTQKIPEHLKTSLSYVCGDFSNKLNFADASFDVIYSKEVLVHIKSKNVLFKEFKRTLKPDGVLVISDFISPIQGAWGPAMKIAFDDNNIYFAHTKKHYLETLKNAGFKSISVLDETERYRNYNQQICDKLVKKRDELIKQFGHKIYFFQLKAYKALVQAFDDGEVFVLRFTAYPY